MTKDSYRVCKVCDTTYKSTITVDPYTAEAKSNTPCPKCGSHKVKTGHDMPLLTKSTPGIFPVCRDNI